MNELSDKDLAAVSAGLGKAHATRRRRRRPAPRPAVYGGLAPSGFAQAAPAFPEPAGGGMACEGGVCRPA